MTSVKRTKSRNRPQSTGSSWQYQKTASLIPIPPFQNSFKNLQTALYKPCTKFCLNIKLSKISLTIKSFQDSEEKNTMSVTYRKFKIVSHRVTSCKFKIIVTLL